jgi:hypothetical protein
VVVGLPLRSSAVVHAGIRSFAVPLPLALVVLMVTVGSPIGSRRAYPRRRSYVVASETWGSFLVWRRRPV